MELADRYGIPHSEFLRWDPDDRDKAIALHLRRRDTCNTCGTRRSEWDEARGGHRRAYVADLDRCPGCEQIGQRRDQLRRDSENGDHPGHGVHLVLKPNPALKNDE